MVIDRLNWYIREFTKTKLIDLNLLSASEKEIGSYKRCEMLKYLLKEIRLAKSFLENDSFSYHRELYRRKKIYRKSIS
jgi:hypothetical protein